MKELFLSFVFGFTALWVASWAMDVLKELRAIHGHLEEINNSSNRRL